MTDLIGKLPVLVINPHSLCNCKCTMCDIWKRRTTEEISPDLFDRQLADMERLGVEWVVFSGGEPLLHADLFRKALELRRRGIRVTLLSSGLLVPRYARQIADHFDDLIVSLDGPRAVHNRIRGVSRAFELLAAGLEQIHAIRLDLPISARCTVQRGNCAHLTGTVAAARGMGLRSVSFLACDIHSGAFNRTPTLELVPANTAALGPADLLILDAQIDELVASGACCGFILESPEKLRRIAHHFRCYLGVGEPVSPICNAPWKSAVIEADGSVRPCFFHAAVGRLDEATGLAQILNGTEAAAFRATLDIANNLTCRQCVCSLKVA